MQTRSQTYPNPILHTHTHTHTHTYTHTHTHARTHACTHARTHARTHAGARAHSQTRELTRTCSQILLPIWQDPICGDGTCQQPWEFPAWGRFGCRAGKCLAGGRLWLPSRFSAPRPIIPALPLLPLRMLPPAASFEAAPGVAFLSAHSSTLSCAPVHVRQALKCCALSSEHQHS